MTKKELLALIVDLQERVRQLEERRPYNPLEPIGPMTIPSFPSVWQDLCQDGKAHEYPTAWWGIFPPPCNKCGKSSQAPNVTYTITNKSCGCSLLKTCTCATTSSDNIEL